MSARRPWSHLVLVSWLAVGCGSDPKASHSITATSYVRTCAGVEDCIPVYEGAVGCCGTGCPNTAIRADAIARYMSDLAAATLATCQGSPPCELSVPFPRCPDGRVACVAGVCQLERASADAAAE